MNAIRPLLPTVVDGTECFLVPLTRGQFAIIDASDAKAVGARNWIACKSKSQLGGWYAYACLKVDGRYTSIQLHRFLLRLDRPTPVVDHKNANGLDNRRSNLRLVTQAQNIANARKRNGCSSMFKGVSRMRNKWMAYITATPGKKRTILGYFCLERDAAKAYNEAAKASFGEFARLNPIPDAP